ADRSIFAGLVDRIEHRDDRCVQRPIALGDLDDRIVRCPLAHDRTAIIGGEHRRCRNDRDAGKSQSLHVTPPFRRTLPSTYIKVLSSLSRISLIGICVDAAMIIGIAIGASTMIKPRRPNGTVRIASTLSNIVFVSATGPSSDALRTSSCSTVSPSIQRRRTSRLCSPTSSP